MFLFMARIYIHCILFFDSTITEIKITSEMEVAPRYTLLYTVHTVYTVYTVCTVSAYCVILLNPIRPSLFERISAPPTYLGFGLG